MLSPPMMEKAEARCLELVNDGEVYKRYDPLFRRAVEKFGVQVMAELAAEAKNGGWVGTVSYSYRFNKIPMGFVVDWENLRDSKKFHSHDGKGWGSEFSRTVFGLVLEDWLISYKEVNPTPVIKPAPVDYKVGDKVRLLVGVSLGGNTRYAEGSVQEISCTGVNYATIPCVEVKGGYCYRLSDVELVVEEPSHLDRAIAEQKEYYAPSKSSQQILAEADAAIAKANATLASVDARFKSTQKEPAMSIKIETKTFVNGAEIAKMTVEELVSLIQRTEDEIKKLEALANKPKKVLKRIEELQTGLAELVKFADAE